MSQNTNKKQGYTYQDYQNAIGKFFPYFKMDVIFCSESESGKIYEDHYAVMQGFYNWIDQSEGILIAIQSSVYILGKHCTQISIVMKSDTSTIPYDTLTKKIVPAYMWQTNCPVYVFQSAIFSEVFSPKDMKKK